MALILNIETATKNCSVSLAKDGKVLAIQEVNNGNYSHAEQLHPLINKVFEIAKYQPLELNAIAVSKGPGSYTGLRIGVSAAKGLCFALDKPLIAVDTLSSLSQSVDGVTDGVIIPMLDARRMEVYAAVFDNDYNQIRDIKAEIVEENTYVNYLNNTKVYFVGDAVSKCKEVIHHENAVFVEDKYPSAAQMAKISYDKYKKSDIENVAYFEPFYLKDFIVIPEKKKKPLF